MALVERADRIRALPPYPFAELDRKKAELIRHGVDVISLGIGDPDLPTPDHIIESLSIEARNPVHHQYPSYEGMLRFREAVAAWYKRRFGVTLDPQREVLSLIGSKEGLAHLPLALVNPGDGVLVPSPGYPVYRVASLFAGGVPYTLPLRRENGFLPDLSAVPVDVASKSKLLFINYPNNPTAAVAGLDFFEHAVEFARRHALLICHDAPYTEIYFDSDPPKSILELDGAKEVAIEFHSLSKTYNMTGWRIGFAVGNADAIAALGQVKTNVDSGVFEAVQCAGISALEGDQSCVEQMRRVYAERRAILIQGLENAGLRVSPCRASFYLWVEVPRGKTVEAFVNQLLDAGIVTTPGTGFGKEGDGYIRMAMTVSADRCREVVRRIQRLEF
ncbi:MAG: LL-diaminopimelate aminotransferase [Deltaproteobacteria bacterium]|nr:LL-diaminopimelate aminotransferase [Deltaproteobacteria bacterium]